MIQLAPPGPPRPLRVTHDDGRNRVQFRLWQIVMTAVTVLATAWFMTFGVWSAVIAVMIAKHVLVVVLLVGLDLPDRRAEPRPAWQPARLGDNLN